MIPSNDFLGIDSLLVESHLCEVWAYFVGFWSSFLCFSSGRFSVRRSVLGISCARFVSALFNGSSTLAGLYAVNVHQSTACLSFVLIGYAAHGSWYLLVRTAHHISWPIVSAGVDLLALQQLSGSAAPAQRSVLL